MYVMDRQSWQFIPVPVVGVRHLYEMCADGLVRKRQGFVNAGECRWQLPHDYSPEEPVLVYRLYASGKNHIVSVAEIFSLHGIFSIPQGWLEAARQQVRLLNQKDWQDTSQQATVFSASLPEMALPEYTMRSCPWQTASIAGDCQGADPILGF